MAGQGGETGLYATTWVAHGGFPFDEQRHPIRRRPKLPYRPICQGLRELIDRHILTIRLVRRKCGLNKLRGTLRYAASDLVTVPVLAYFCIDLS